MKKMLLAAVVILMFSGLVGAQQLYQQTGIYLTPATPTNTAVSLSSTTTTTIAALPYGVQRIFVNISTSTIYMSKASSVAATVRSGGLPLYTKSTYIEDKYFGAMYFIGDAGVVASGLRYETLRGK